MRVAFVSHSFPPEERPLANVGGMQRVAVELNEALHAHPDVEVSTLALRSTWRWTHVRTVPFLAKVGRRLRQMAERKEIDVVLFSSMVTATLALPLRSILEKNDVAAAAIVHGRDVTLPFPPYQWLVPRVFDALDLVLPVSQATGAACQERGLSSAKLHVVPNGIDLDRFAAPSDKAAMRRQIRAALGDPDRSLPEEALLLCSVGRQVERKGFAWFVDNVMPLFPDDVHYWLAGDGPRQEEIRAAAARHQLDGRVRLLGRVPNDKLETLYRGADLFIMPNVPVNGDMEGFGVVILEAGQCGCPTVAARLEGIRDVITEGENGHLVESKNPWAFFEAVMHYRDNRSALHDASARAVAYVEEHFGWSAIADRYVRALQALRGAPVEAR